MIIRKTSRLESTRILFVWDGQRGSIATAERFSSSAKNPSVHTVHVLPHESIRAYGTAISYDCEPSAFETKLQLRFGKATRFTQFLKHSQLELLFGERIVEVVRVATIIKTDVILLPKFEQSRFSLWLHGDLNSRLLKESPCKVVFYDSVESEQQPVKEHKNSKSRSGE